MYFIIFEDCILFKKLILKKNSIFILFWTKMFIKNLKNNLDVRDKNKYLLINLETLKNFLHF